MARSTFTLQDAATFKVAANFPSMDSAMRCAIVHARQRGGALVVVNDRLAADFRLMPDGTVSIVATSDMARDWVAKAA
jgi:hypothetical protein